MNRSCNWSDVPGDVWFSIGLRLDEASDRIRFRAVSKSLRSSLPYRQPPWLMLSENKEDKPPRRRFVILGEQSHYKFDLPQAQHARCIGSTNTWVITVKKDATIRLLNPFSKLQFDLPSERTFERPDFGERPDLLRDMFLKKVIICPPASSTGTNLLVIALQYEGRLEMARPGDSRWTSFRIDHTFHHRFTDKSFRIENWTHTGIRNMVVYKGRRLFAIDYRGVLMSCKIRNHRNSGPLIPPVLTQFGPTFDKIQLHLHSPDDGPSQLLYLVECSGQLLLVIKVINMFAGTQKIRSFPIYKTQRFQIYKFDFSTRNWTEIKSLGEYSLFLGYNSSQSVLASEFLGLMEKNCIYFTDDFWYGYFRWVAPAGYDMGVFHLDDNTITPHYKGLSTSTFSPPIWIVPD